MKQVLMLAAVLMVLLQASSAISIEIPSSVTYVLQAEKLGESRSQVIDRLADSARDWIVLDVSCDASEDGRWSAEETRRIKSRHEGRKVLAYLSIGEAEAYRKYWQPEWDADRHGKPDTQAPAWLVAPSRGWKGNYKVRYWHQAWQRMVLDELGRIIEQGFDGVYLDIVDGFEFFEYELSTNSWISNRVNPETGSSYRQDMVGWVIRLATDARKRNKDFLIVPQNGAQLLADQNYINTVDAIGIEDLYTDGERRQSGQHVRQMTRLLNKMKKTGKPVLVIEYARKKSLQRLISKKAIQNGYVLLITDRKLETLGVSRPRKSITILPR